MEEQNIKVYAKIDSNNNITSVNSGIFLQDTAGWIETDEGIGDKYVHAQGNYFSMPILTESGIYRYKWIGEIYEKTDEEIQSEIVASPTAPSIEEQLAIVQAAILALMDIEVM